jgi:hypothetical protein
MGQPYPPNSRQARKQAGLDGSPLGSSERSCDEPTDDDVASVLEENARLRSLVVKLSEIILRNVVD